MFFSSSLWRKTLLESKASLSCLVRSLIFNFLFLFLLSRFLRNVAMSLCRFLVLASAWWESAGFILRNQLSAIPEVLAQYAVKNSNILGVQQLDLWNSASSDISLPLSWRRLRLSRLYFTKPIVSKPCTVIAQFAARNPQIVSSTAW